jgi:hypothetical protein
LDSQTWALTKYQIQYNATSLDTGVGFNIRLFKNDPITDVPGAVVYNGGFFYDLAVGNHTITYDNSDFGNLYLAGSYTFAITFQNLGSSVIQLPLADSPTGQPGTSYGDYWRNNAGIGNPPVWELVSPTFGQANLLMNVEGTPEPSVMALSALGGVLLLGVNKLRRKRA